MRTRQRNLITIILGLATIGYILFLYFSTSGLSVPVIPWVLVTFLIAYTTIYGIPLGVGEVSLVPTVTLTSLFAIGIIPTTIAIIFSDLLYGLIRGLSPSTNKWQPQEDGFSLAATTMANITMHVFSALSAGIVFYGLQGSINLQTGIDIIVIIVTGAAYISTNYIFAGLFLLMRSKAHFRSLVGHLSKMLFYEAIPIIIAPLMAMILTQLGTLPFIVVVFGIIFIANILRDRAKAQRDLERRIQEISSVQALGESLSSTLDINLIGDSIYQQVLKLMPAGNFYLALWNEETDEVSFSTVYQENKKIEGQSRTAGQGLTEYVIRNKKPVLIEKNVKSTVESLGLEHYGREALSWLGVPILAGSQAIGMIAVQSYPDPEQIQTPYDIHHQEILATIAAQASVAIQNAWLYTQTDKALAQRVRELNSIMYSTTEGIMLLDLDLKVVEVNWALCDMLNIHPGAIINKNIPADQSNAFSMLLIEESIIQQLEDQSVEYYQDVVTLQGNGDLPTERTISPVQDSTGRISGWLCVFRDMREEIRLENLKEDLSRMLVHDLRSPIVTIKGGLDMIEVLIEDNDPDSVLEMVEIARKGSNRMLEMINDLLNVTQLESGELNMILDSVDLPAICQEEIHRFHPIAQQMEISFHQKFKEPFPTIHGDSELLKRVFHNILDNALKFSPQGSQIEIWGSLDEQDQNFVQVGVKDQGPGIQPDDIGMLFEKYFTSQQGKSKRRGTGLGLYFCKLAVEAHHGKIWVESNLGEGSQFIIRLPQNPKQ